MNVGQHQLDLVKALSFVRWGGTEEEKKAAQIIADEIKSYGGSSEFMPFQIPAYECETCKVTICDPYEKEIDAVPYGRTGDVEGVFDLLYVAGGEEMDFLGTGDLSNTVLLLDSFSFNTYETICKKKPAAFMVISGKYYDSPENSDLMPRPMRDRYLEEGKIPGFQIWAKDAMAMVRDGVKKVRLELKQREYEATSQNVVAVIPGTDESCEEDIVITGHYDSVLVGTGSWDNATGSVALLYLYKHFLANPAKRTLRFVWCGTEEQGLFGSHAYVDQNPELIEKRIKFCFNFDMNGTILGSNNVMVTGTDELKSYAQQYCKEVGWSAEMRQGVHSSDSAPFCDKGIPAIGLSRGTRTGEIHTRNDLPVILSAKRLEEMGRFSAAFVSRTANSITLPVETGMPDKMKEELDKYFQRDKKKQDEKKQEEAKAEKG